MGIIGIFKKNKFIYLFILIFLFISFYNFNGCKKKPEESITYTRKEEISFIVNFGTPIDIILILDHSDSMKGYTNFPATDPNNLRIEASKYFINNLSRRSEYEPYLKVGVINFGTNVPKEYIIDLTTITSKSDDTGVEKIINSLKPLSLGYTSFIRAFNSAYELFIKNKTIENNRKPIIVLFTDGEPDDERGYPLKEYFNEIKNFYNKYLNKIGCEIYLIGIDKIGNVWNKTIPYWEEIINKDHIFKISDIEELNQKYNEIIQKIFYLPTTTPDIIVKSLDFDVQPYLDKIQFDIYPETKNISLEITDAEGKKITENDPNVFIKDYPTYRTIIISNPIPGKWKYEIVKGEGKVKIYKTLIPNKMSLITPQNKEILGRKFNIVFAFLKEDQTEIKLLPDYPLIFSGKLISPKGEVEKIEFIKEDKGIYRSKKDYEPQLEGNYKIILNATGREGFEITNEYIITIIKAPYIVVNYPLNNSIIKGYKNNLKVEASLYYGKDLIDPNKFFDNDPNTLIWAQIVFMPNNKKSKIVIPLKQSEDNKAKFYEYIPEKLNQKGNYILKVELDGKINQTKEIYKDTVTTMFTLKPSIIDLLKLYWFVLVLLILISYFIYYIIFTSKRAKLEGELIIDGNSHSLKGYKMTLGGKGSDINVFENINGPLAIIYGRYVKSIDEKSKEKEIIIKYKSSIDSKNFDMEEILTDEWSITIIDKNIKFKKI